VEIEDENHSVSDLMTTEDEDEPDDDQDDDEDDRNDDGDDEPLLGSWMESVLSPPDVDLDLEGKHGTDRDGRNGLGDEKKAADDDIKALIQEFVRNKDSAMSVRYIYNSIVCL
jgi:hypothetical protein